MNTHRILRNTSMSLTQRLCGGQKLQRGLFQRTPCLFPASHQSVISTRQSGCLVASPVKRTHVEAAGTTCTSLLREPKSGHVSKSATEPHLDVIRTVHA